MMRHSSIKKRLHRISKTRFSILSSDSGDSNDASSELSNAELAAIATGTAPSPPGTSPTSLRRKVFRKTRKKSPSAREASEDTDEDEELETAVGKSPKTEGSLVENEDVDGAGREREERSVRRPIRLSTVATLVMALRTKGRRQRESRRNSIVKSERNSLASADRALGLEEGLTRGLNAFVSDDEDAARIEMRGPQKEEMTDGNLGDGVDETATRRVRRPADAAVGDKKFVSRAFKRGRAPVAAAAAAVRRPKDGSQTQLKGGKRRPHARAGGGGDAQLSAPPSKEDGREGAKKTSRNCAADGREGLLGGRVAPAPGRTKRLSNLDLFDEKTTTTSRMEPESSEWQRRKTTTKSKHGLGKQPLQPPPPPPSRSILPDGSERGRRTTTTTTQKRPSKMEGRRGGGGEGVLNHRQKDDKKAKVEEERNEFGAGRMGLRRGRGRPQISARLELGDGNSGCVL